MVPIAPYCPEYACQPIFFNQKQFRRNLQDKPVIKVFKDAIAGANAHFDSRFLEGEDIRQLVNDRSNFVDMLLHYAWHQHSWDEDICLIAVGGYGRGELHPHSDIDILILTENNIDDKYSANLEALITFLWDIGLEIGSSVRTLEQCVALAENDISVATNIQEARRIAGNDKLRDQLHILTGPEYMWPADKFYAAKVAEQNARHKKFNYTECDLEPNIKNAPGGLRDVQTIHWLAKRYFGVQTLLQLDGKDFFTEEEFGSLRSGEALLWKVRYGVHYLAKRGDERLLFEHQRELANFFGFTDGDTGLAVEKFMHQYYRSVLTIRELNDVLLQYLNEKIHADSASHRIEIINDHFQLRDDYIEVRHSKVFEQYPSALLEIFVHMGERSEIKGVRAETIRLVRESRHLIDENFRNDPQNSALFLQLLNVKHGVVTQLKRMKRYNILGRYLPEFGRITGQMQHDLFHRYTVDDHTLLVVQNLRRFTLPDAEQEFPIAAHILKHMDKPELLYLAGLYHDIGKGRGGDHSVLGAVDAQKFCEKLGLSRHDCHLVSWLVEKHLLMSYISQKKDLSDPDTIHDFAVQVGDQRRLNYLYALTVADMCGTNPDIWNSWRASLMRQLYLETKRALRRGLGTTVDQQDIIEETQDLARFKLLDKGFSENQIDTLWEEMGDDYFLRESHLDIAWQTESILEHNSTQPLVLVRESFSQIWAGATEIFIRTKDEDHVFLAAVTALAQVGLNVQDARLYSSNTQYTIYTFYVLDNNYEQIGDNPEKINAIREAVLEELCFDGEYSEIVKRRTPRTLKQFATPTRTTISNDINGSTVLEVISPDRPWLLASIARIFMDMDIRLQNAKISTLGERVEDIFFLTNHQGQVLSDPKICAELQATICQQLDLQVEKQDLKL